MAHVSFVPAEQLSFNVQAVDITVREAVKGSVLLVSHLKSLRTDTMFNRFYEKTISKFQSLTDQPKLPRNRTLPKWSESGTPAHQYQCARDLYHQAYYEALDLVSEEVTRRFKQEDLFLVKEIQLLMLNAANGNFMESILDNITNFLQNKFDLDRLKVQLCMIPDMIKTEFDSSVKKVTNVRTISSAVL